LWIATPAVAVWDEPPAIPPSGKSDESEPVGCDLGECGPRALSHVVGTDFHDAAAVPAQYRPRLRRKHDSRKCRGTHTPADEQAVAIAHLSRGERPALPAKPLGTLPVAFAQSFR
jgi:hypothetical protein